MFANFGVLPHEETDWPPLFSLLTDVWAVDPELLLDVLGRSCLRRSLRSDTAAISAEDILVREDVAGDRGDQQMQRGYVGPLEAAVMLGNAKSTSLENLLIEVAYDGTSAVHLRRLHQQQETAAAEKAAQAKSSHTPSTTENEVQGDTPNDWDDIEGLLASVEIIPTKDANALLEGPVKGPQRLSRCALRPVNRKGSFSARRPSGRVGIFGEYSFLWNHNSGRRV